MWHSAFAAPGNAEGAPPRTMRNDAPERSTNGEPALGYRLSNTLPAFRLSQFMIALNTSA